MRTRTYLISVGFCALCTAFAGAQSNSLFGRSQQRVVPIGQPAPQQPTPQAQSESTGIQIPQPAALPRIPQRGEFDSNLNPNPTLLAMSPIGVAAPQKEKIKPGALVTIIVREVKQALTDSNLRSQKQWDLAAELRQWIRLTDEDKIAPAAFPNGTPNIEFDLNDNYQGRGRVDRRDELITRITATVIDVKPNGTLVLQAKKSIALDEETQHYTLTGKVRVEDLTAQNTVLSTQVADLDLSVQHEGAARDATKRNIFKKISDFFGLT
ncbi:MAG: flagellar basal body L-ring protein FlgH [Phycisphaerae bacterium]